MAAAGAVGISLLVLGFTPALHHTGPATAAVRMTQQRARMTQQRARMTQRSMHMGMEARSALQHLVTAATALTIGLAPMPMSAVSDTSGAPFTAELSFESSALVSEGLKSAGMDGDVRMIKLWAQLKAGALQAEGQNAAAKVNDEKTLANARKRVRSVAPYLDEAQRDVFAGRWKFVQGYVGVVFSQFDAFQTVINDNFPGGDPVSLASRDALSVEGANILKNAEALAAAAKKGSESEAISAYAKLSLSYDRFLKAGDLYGNALLLPAEGKRPKARPKPAAPTTPAVVVAQNGAAAAAVQQDTAEDAAEAAAKEVIAKEAAARKAAAVAAAAETTADRAEAASEKADDAVERAAAAKAAAAEKAATVNAKGAKAKAETAARAAATKEAKAAAAAEAKEKAELQAEAAEAKAKAEATQRAAALKAAEERLRVAEEKEKAATATVRLYEKAIEYEMKQEAASEKLAAAKDTTASLVPQYDPLTSTEPLFKDTPLSSLQYSTAKPKVKDAIVVIAGPDKGRVGVLIGVESNGSCIIKLSTKELKVIDLDKIAKQK